MTQLSWGGEFGLELQVLLPYAWWLHQRCWALRTESVGGSLPLYFFAHQHTERVGAHRGAVNYSCCPIKEVHHPHAPGGIHNRWSPEARPGSVWELTAAAVAVAAIVSCDKFTKISEKKRQGARLRTQDSQDEQSTKDMAPQGVGGQRGVDTDS